MVRQAGKSGGFLGECWICSPASHIFTRHRFPPPSNFQKLVCNVQKSSRAALQLPASAVQSDILQGQNGAGEAAPGVFIWGMMGPLSCSFCTRRNWQNSWTAGSSFHHQLLPSITSLPLDFLIYLCPLCKERFFKKLWNLVFARCFRSIYNGPLQWQSFLLLKAWKILQNCLQYYEAIITDTVYTELFLLIP